MDNIDDMNNRGRGKPITLLLPRLLALSLATAFSCGGTDARTTVSAGPPRGITTIIGEVAGRTTLDNEFAVGISGSCQDGDTRWLVAERNAHLLRLDRDGRIQAIAIDGIPEGYDLEGLACKDGRFYISTETEVAGRSEDKVFVVELVEDRAKVVDTLSLRYPPPMKAGKNQGLEGLCIAGDWLVAAGEILRTTAAGLRQAPILRTKLGKKGAPTHLHWLNLTTRTGKISGLDCNERGGIIEVFAVERHYEVSRVLRFELGRVPSRVLTLVEMAGFIRKTENYEAIVVDARGRIGLNNDNQYKTITDPSEDVVLQAIPEFAH